MTLFQLPYDTLLDANGDPISGGKIIFYEAGTTTPLDTFSDEDLSTANTNPVVADSNGRIGPVFLKPQAYKVVVTDASDVTIKTVDNYRPVSSGAQVRYAATVGGTADVITLTLDPAITALEDGMIIWFMPSGDNTTNVTVNPNGLGASALVALDGSALTGAELQSTGPAIISYDLGNTRFVLLNTHLPLSTRGDLLTVGDNAVIQRLALGTNGQLVGSDGLDTEYVDRIILGTEQVAPGSSFDFTSIPSWAKYIAVVFAGLSLSGTDNPAIQLGDSTGLKTTGYAGASTQIVGATASSTSFTTAFGLKTGDAAAVIHGVVELFLEDPSSNTWVAKGTLARSDTAATILVAGLVSLSGALDRFSIITSGTDTIDAGAANYQLK